MEEQAITDNHQVQIFQSEDGSVQRITMHLKNIYAEQELS